MRYCLEIVLHLFAKLILDILLENKTKILIVKKNFLQCGFLVLWKPCRLVSMVESKAVGPCLIMIILHPTSPPSPAPALSNLTTSPSNRADLPAPTVKKDRIYRTPQIHVSCALAVCEHPTRGQDFAWQSSPAWKPKDPSVYPSSEEVYFSVSPFALRYDHLQEPNQISQPVFSNLLLIKTAVILAVVRCF